MGRSSLVYGVVGVILGAATMLGGFFIIQDQEITKVVRENFEVKVETISPSEVTEIIEGVRHSVVGVTVSSKALEDVLGSLLGEGTGRVTPATTGGSGIIYRTTEEKGFIVANQHVVEGEGTIEISLDDGTILPAEVVGSDVWMDLAVLAVVNDGSLQPAVIGDSRTLLPGQSVIAIGDPLGFLTGSVTMGIVSSRERLMPMDLNNDGTPDWEAIVIQTDAAINPGNSGGALLDASGAVIGINSSKLTGEAIEGLGFAIPISEAMPILAQLETGGQVKRAQMGVQLLELNNVPLESRQRVLNLPNNVTVGLIITEVASGSPADKAGLEAYDVIVAIDGFVMDSMVTLRQYLFGQKEPGDQISITYYRDGRERSTRLTLGASEAR